MAPLDGAASRLGRVASDACERLNEIVKKVRLTRARRYELGNKSAVDIANRGPLLNIQITVNTVLIKSNKRSSMIQQTGQRAVAQLLYNKLDSVSCNEEKALGTRKRTHLMKSV
jgi:hypothetical protein